MTSDPLEADFEAAARYLASRAFGSSKTEVLAHLKADYSEREVLHPLVYLIAEARRQGAALSKAEPVAWQRRYMHTLAGDPPGKAYQWGTCSRAEATGHFEKQPGYEYRGLYAAPQRTAEQERKKIAYFLMAKAVDYSEKGQHDIVAAIAAIVDELDPSKHTGASDAG